LVKRKKKEKKKKEKKGKKDGLSCAKCLGACFIDSGTRALGAAVLFACYVFRLFFELQGAF